MGIPPRLPWQMLWPFRRRMYADWLFWALVAVVVVETQISTMPAIIVGWGFGIVWNFVALARWWRS